MTIPYPKCNRISHLNFEIGGDFLGIWGSLCPKGMQKLGFNEKIGVICVPKNKFFEVFLRKNGVNIFGSIQNSHPWYTVNNENFANLV